MNHWSAALPLPTAPRRTTDATAREATKDRTFMIFSFRSQLRRGLRWVSAEGLFSGWQTGSLRTIGPWSRRLSRKYGRVAMASGRRSSPRPIDSVLHQELTQVDDHREDLLVPVATLSLVRALFGFDGHAGRGKNRLHEVAQHGPDQGDQEHDTRLTNQQD